MKILYLLSRFPYPLEKGDKLRAYQHLQNLNASGHEVHLVAISDKVVDEKAYQKIKPLCKSITVLPLSLPSFLTNVAFSFFRKLPLQAGYFYSRKNQDIIDNVISTVAPDLIYCQLVRTAGYIKNHSEIPLVIDFQDAFSKGTEQRMGTAPWWIKPLFTRELRLIKKLEAQSYEWFNGHLIISPQDKSALAVSAGKNVDIVPNGVDTSFFFPVKAEKNADITFVGNMNYPPNVDGASFLVEEIMPFVWKQFPAATVQIAGANPNKKVRALASRLVTVTGWVEDIRQCYSTSKIFVAPMRMGTGLQNKLLEAMAMGTPCVTTSLSFEPLGAEAGSDILVGNNASELADQIVRLLKDEVLRKNIGENGLKFVQTNYSMEHSRILLEKVLSEAIRNFDKSKQI